MPTRRIHHVGTLGGPEYAPAAAIAAEVTGQYCVTFPTDEPEGWVIEPIRALGQRPEILTLIKSRFHQNPMRVWHGAVYTARPGKRITPDTLGLDYTQRVARSVPVLHDLAHAAGYYWRPQVDIPGPLDFAALSFGPLVPRYYRTTVEATSLQVNAIESTGIKPVYQLSVPVEVFLIASAPAALQQTVVELLAARLVSFITSTTPGTEWILHPCNGDPHGRPLKDPLAHKPANPRLLKAAVLLVNAVWKAWPAGYRLNAVHLPMGDGTHPAPADPRYYVALRLLDVHGVHVSAGLANLNAPLHNQQVALAEAERAARRALGVSTPCGLGRRPHAAQLLLQRMVELAQL